MTATTNLGRPTTRAGRKTRAAERAQWLANRDSHIEFLHDLGLTQASIARRVFVTERTVARRLKMMGLTVPRSGIPRA